MSSFLLEQLLETLILFYCGMVLMVLREWMQGYQARRQPCRSTLFVQEISYWLLSGLLASSFFYYASYGRLSVHGLLALVAGAFFWKTLFMNKNSPNPLTIYDIISRKQQQKEARLHGVPADPRQPPPQ